MDSNVKKTIFTVIYAVAAFAAFVGIFALVANAVELLLYTTYYGSSTLYSPSTLEKAYWKVQFVGAVFCILAAVVSIAVFLLQFFLVRKKISFKLGALIRYGLILLLLVFIIIHFVCFVTYKAPKGVPIHVWSTAIDFPIYSGVKSLLIQQFVYFLAMATIEIGAFRLKKKAEQTASQSASFKTPGESAAKTAAASGTQLSVPLSSDEINAEIAAPLQKPTENDQTKPV